MYQGAIFDLDGTILDSMGVWRQIDVEFLGRRGISVPPDYLEAITPLGFDRAAEYTIRRFSLPESREEIVREWYLMAENAYRYQVELKEGAGEWLNRLKSLNIPLAVATSSDEALFVPALKRTGIYDCFDAFVTVKEVARGKGFPDIYEKAAGRIGCVPEQCVVFEDILQGIRGAKMGGFCAVAVYDEDSAHEEQAMRDAADYYIYSFRQLLEGDPGLFDGQ
ncbi:MAG TPA: HAD family phosphatase [Candidatus Fusicatenibacter intestinigallinarum]|uniref:HAD family phosphatase n=1 Tax=Candidatus Fusicatenibacter intestinigallinarum TaxID=2838598 RepID=A0A9D2NBE0_9FIRM|nr:HAD family phosphatase [Candidatus Fusicatenibacter intestinigallinarum]